VIDNFLRTVIYVAACVASVLLYIVFVGGVGVIGGMAPILDNGVLTWDTTAYESREYHETERTRIEETNDTARTLAAQETLRVWAMWGMAGAVAIVIAVQAGRTIRHVATVQSQERRLLLLFAAQCLPDGHNIKVERVGPERQLVVRDYDTMQQWPAETARTALVERGLLTVDGEVLL
jgi:hypothetical protein